MRRVRLVLAPLTSQSHLPPEVSAMLGESVDRASLARDLNRLQDWCSPAQRSALDGVTQATGIYLDDQISVSSAENYVRALEAMCLDTDSEEIPL